MDDDDSVIIQQSVRVLHVPEGWRLLPVFNAARHERCHNWRKALSLPEFSVDQCADNMLKSFPLPT
jgi:hypothetical protein